MKKQYIIHSWIIFAIAVFHFDIAQAVTTAINVDSTLGANQTINNVGGIYTISEGNGKPDATNNNLFFSFSTFNVGAGNTASFDLPTGWSNVITRVTGGTASTIDGRLQVGSGFVDHFFFINPSGITFGPGSVVDVPGSFYASTASALNFSDGSSYRADGTQPSGLSSTDPVSFGFLGNETGALNLNQTQIQVFDDTRLELVGHDINIDSSTLGQVNLVANGFSPYHVDGIQMLLMATHSQTAGTVDLAGQNATIKLDGNINIANTTLLNAGGDAEEIQLVRGGNISLNNAHIISDNYGDDCGGFCANSFFDPNIPLSGIDITATGKLTLDNTSSIESETSFNPVGNINIQTQSLLLDNNSKITTSSIDVAHINYLAAGTIPVPHPINPQAGDINIAVANDFVARGGSSILSSTETFGNAGHISIAASSMALNNASIKSESTSNTNSLIGYAVDTNGDILSTANNIDFNNLYSSSNQLVTATHNAGDAGQITLNSKDSIALANGSLISTDVSSASKISELGKITLSSQSGAITLDGSTVSSVTRGDANAGDISLSASGPLQMSNNAKITTDSSGAKLGNSGAIAVNAKALTMNTGVISSSSKSLGSAGQITVNTPDAITLANSLISTDVQNGTPSSQTGKIALNAQAGAITMDSSTVSSTTSGDANAGDISLSASGPLQMSNNAKITTDSSGAKLGNSGAIAVNAKALTMNTGVISSSSKSLGSAGQITVNTPDAITLANSLISTDVQNGTPSSQTGKIALNAQAGAITMDSSTVSSTTSGDANAGDISLSASGPLQMSNNAKITTDSSGAKLGNSGAIAVNAKALTMNTGVISSSSKSLGSAGQITVNTPDAITLANSLISTDVQNGTPSSQTGKIALNAQAGAITMDGSTVSSTTSGDANAGDISLSASGPLQMSNNAKITTDSSGAKLGNSGAIAVNAKALTMNTGVISSSSKSLGSAGQITVNTPDAITLANSLISTDVQNGTPSSQTGKIALNAQAGAITMDSSTVSSTTSGDANAGDISLSASGPLQMSNNAKITTDSSGAKLGNSGAIAVNAKALTMNTGVISSSSKSLGSAGQITVNTPDAITLANSLISTDVQNGTPSSQTGKIALNAQAGAITMDSSTVSSTTSGDANAGDISLSASGPLQMSNNAKITTDSSGAKLGNSGAIAVNAKALTMNTGVISSSSKSLGSAGQITVNTPDAITLANSLISTDVQNGTPSSQTGKIALNAQAGAITMDGSTVSSTTSGDANAGDISLSASGPLQMSNNAKITTDSSGAKLGNSGAIAVNAKALTMNTGVISSSSKSLGSAGQITVNTPDAITLANSLISTDVQNGTPSSQTGKIALNAQAGAITMDSSTVSSTTSGDANAGDITLSASGPLQMRNNAKIATDSLGLNGNKLGDSGIISISVKDLTMESGSAITSSSNSLGSAGTVTINTQGPISLVNSLINTDVSNASKTSQPAKITLNSQSGAVTLDGSTVSSVTRGDANAGDIVVSANGSLKMSNNSKITTDSLGLNGGKLGDSGIISVTSKDLNIETGSFISSSTSSLGRAGTVTVNTGNLNIRGLGIIPISQLGRYIEPNFTGIRSMANIGSGGQTGFINITARDNVNLSNGAQISISNQANVADTSALVPTHISIFTPNLGMTNSQIVADSSGNVDAGDINITFTGLLYMDPSAISTLANNGNGGDIVINGGNMFWLQDSAITTSVLGLQGNGGNISIKSDYLIMDSGFIQANTAAKGASGGTVNVDVTTIIPSGSLLFLGGNTPYRFQPFSGINVIQAAAPDGVKGQVNTTTPQLNLSGTLADLILQSFDQNALSRNLCAIGSSSSLSQSGKGGLRRNAKDALLSTPF